MYDAHCAAPHPRVQPAAPSSVSSLWDRPVLLLCCAPPTAADPVSNAVFPSRYFDGQLESYSWEKFLCGEAACVSPHLFLHLSRPSAHQPETEKTKQPTVEYYGLSLESKEIQCFNNIWILFCEHILFIFELTDAAKYLYRSFPVQACCDSDRMYWDMSTWTALCQYSILETDLYSVFDTQNTFR